MVTKKRARAGREHSTGSGIVINTKGEILTNSHVVEACRTITVKFASGSSETGLLAARDERNDLAVVRVSGAHFGCDVPRQENRLIPRNNRNNYRNSSNCWGK
jgi:S1-C subfamily serine protease